MEIKNFSKEETENVLYLTIPYEDDFPLLDVNYDIYERHVEVEGKRHRVMDCLVSDNGESIVIVCVK